MNLISIKVYNLVLQIMEQKSNYLDETDCQNNSFADLIQREVFKNLRRYEEEKKQYLVLKQYIPTFTEEIRCMMHTHGDLAGPLPESVLLVGTIVRDQMNMLLIKATEASTSNKERFTHENILQVLRENKGKLKRLLSYLKLRDMKDYIYKRKPLIEDGEEKPADNISASASKMLTKLVDRSEYGRRVRTCLEFLRKTDKSFDCVAIMDNSVQDPITINRLKRRYLITLNMSDPEYLEYARKLQASFYPKGGGKLFSKWLLVDKVTHLVPEELALEMINYLAYETVAEIVDLSLRLIYNRNAKKHAKENINESTSLSESMINKGTLAFKRKFQDDDFNSISSDSFVGTESDFPINTHDIESLSKYFGDEFKEGVKKEPITPDIINEVLNLCSGNYKHKYDEQWKRAKGYSLLCTQDNYTIFLQKR